MDDKKIIPTDVKPPVPDNVKAAHEAKRLTAKQNKELFLKALSVRLLNVSSACKVVGVGRNTVYKWRDKDDAFKKEWDNIVEEFKDNLETAMFNKAVVQEDTTMMIWLSKTKMKDRGYIEKVEQDVTVNPFLELMKSASIEKDE